MPTLLVLAAGAGWLALGNLDRQPGGTPSPAAHSEPRAQMAGVTYEAEGGLRLTARQIVQRPRRLGVLAVNPWRELVIQDAQLLLPLRPEVDDDQHSSRTSHTELPFDEVILDFARAVGGGVVTRVRIENLEIAAEDAQGRVFTIAAAEARLESKSELDLRGGVTIHTREGRHLEAERAGWDHDDWRIRVRGPYELSDAGHTAAGRDGVFVLDRTGALRR